MWQIIRNKLHRWMLGLLEPTYKAELDAVEQIKAAKQREIEALQGEITKLDQQITDAQSRQMKASNELESHLAEVDDLEASIHEVQNEKQIDTSSISDNAALRDSL